MYRCIPRLIWIFTILIIAMGLMALYSASYQNTRVSNKVFFDQLIFSVVGILMILFLSHFDYKRLYDLAYLLYGLTIVLLILVLLVGRYALGAQRWFTVGSFSFQPSELAKLALILTLGRYFHDHQPRIPFNFLSATQIFCRDLVFPLMITALPMVLIFKQPDLGTSILFLGIFLIMLIATEVRYRYVIGLLLICLVCTPLAWHILKPYQKDRLLVFLNPNIDPLGAGYTIIQSKIAIGSGQFIGKGWLSGTQNQLNFLPERHTDFIFSVIGEEWGLLGTVFLLICYFVLIHCGIVIAETIKDKFGMLICLGIVGILSLQVVINVGMAIGLCPVVGITLPLISYGRSSFMVFIILIGILLNLSKKRTIF